jgi:hypothetical protein
MNPMDPLSQLRDIHLPAPVGWWPPAPGWWLLTLGLIALIVGSSLWMWQRYRKRAYRREALAQLQQIRDTYQTNQDAQYLLSELSALLKRTAITRYGRDEIAGLTGQRWLTFLDRTGQTNQFSSGEGQALAQRFGPTPTLNGGQLLNAVEHWLKKQS